MIKWIKLKNKLIKLKGLMLSYVNQLEYTATKGGPGGHGKR
jgi:hypothetical protein